MSVDFFAAVAQIVAAIGVIVSLVYVGVQIRQATRATKLASIQAVETAIGRTEELIIQDASFAAILKHGLTASGADLADTDRIRLNVFYRHVLRAYQSAHYQYRHGALDDSVWLPLAKGLAALFQADRGLREHFAVEKYMLDASFAALCEKLLRDVERLTITSGHKPIGDAVAVPTT
ncbi:MAG TPA: hypothetical protein VMV37_03430 [Gammaproteobacteria bacterium]|nr:hypothetical protein [Gammaproteobacteria bacterium]